VNVEVILRSNQFEYDSVMGRIKSFKRHGYNEQIYLHYAADSCEDAGTNCAIDDSIDFIKFKIKTKLMATLDQPIRPPLQVFQPSMPRPSEYSRNTLKT